MYSKAVRFWSYLHHGPWAEAGPDHICDGLKNTETHIEQLLLIQPSAPAAQGPGLELVPVVQQKLTFAALMFPVWTFRPDSLFTFWSAENTDRK